MSKAEKKAWEWSVKNKLDPYSMGRAYGEGYNQAEKDIKKELSDLFQEFTLDCINDDKDIHILHFMDVFKNKLKTIGNE